LPWEEKLVKYHVEDRQDYNKEERRHLYIDCYYLLYQSLSESLSPNIWSKTEMKIQKKRKEEHLH